MISEYQHTQKGTLIVRVLLGGFAFCLLICLTIKRDEPTVIFICGSVGVVLLAFAYLFASLTVQVSHQWIDLRFGPGLFKKRFAVGELVGARVVRNRWWYGWGIKITPHGWLYNVSGLDAVEIELKSGKKYRIGTDEPAALHDAIRQVLPS